MHAAAEARALFIIQVIIICNVWIVLIETERTLKQ